VRGPVPAEIRNRAYVNTEIRASQSNPESMLALRQKFIQTAKKYLGVPYAAMFHKEGDEFYGAPLYLDCCALVRRCVDDLFSDFGFQMGRWNQAYQCDTLPDAISLEDMRPGGKLFKSAALSTLTLGLTPHVLPRRPHLLLRTVF
jgi:hypothetical protein